MAQPELQPAASSVPALPTTEPLCEKRDIEHLKRRFWTAMDLMPGGPQSVLAPELFCVEENSLLIAPEDCPEIIGLVDQRRHYFEEFILGADNTSKITSITQQLESYGKLCRNARSKVLIFAHVVWPSKKLHDAFLITTGEKSEEVLQKCFVMKPGNAWESALETCPGLKQPYYRRYAGIFELVVAEFDIAYMQKQMQTVFQYEPAEIQQQEVPIPSGSQSTISEEHQAVHESKTQSLKFGIPSWVHKISKIIPRKSKEKKGKEEQKRQPGRVEHEDKPLPPTPSKTDKGKEPEVEPREANTEPVGPTTSQPAEEQTKSEKPVENVEKSPVPEHRGHGTLDERV